jgi:CRP-like cAMP-binding protein
MQYLHFKKGDYVFKFGDFGDKFYIILKGEVSVRIPDPKNRLNNS